MISQKSDISHLLVESYLLSLSKGRCDWFDNESRAQTTLFEF